jgi:hypothetical protein
MRYALNMSSILKLLAFFYALLCSIYILNNHKKAFPKSWLVFVVVFVACAGFMTLIDIGFNGCGWVCTDYDVPYLFLWEILEFYLNFIFIASIFLFVKKLVVKTLKSSAEIIKLDEDQILARETLLTASLCIPFLHISSSLFPAYGSALLVVETLVLYSVFFFVRRRFLKRENITLSYKLFFSFILILIGTLISFYYSSI